MRLIHVPVKKPSTKGLSPRAAAVAHSVIDAFVRGQLDTEAVASVLSRKRKIPDKRNVGGHFSGFHATAPELEDCITALEIMLEGGGTLCVGDEQCDPFKPTFQTPLD